MLTIILVMIFIISFDSEQMLVKWEILSKSVSSNY